MQSIVRLAICGCFALYPAHPAWADIALEARLAEHILSQHDMRLNADETLTVKAVSQGITETMPIQQIDFDRASGRFSALINTGSHLARIYGRAYVEKPATVPTRTIRPGERITANDLVREPLRLSDISPDAVLDGRDLIGQEARRALPAGRPIEAHQIGAPTIVSRNSLVEISYASSQMKITGKGRALSDGGLNEMVQVMNIASKKVIEARIIGHGHVEVSF
jgi:flagella basal body P-ring formation protein FlgA